MVRVQCPHCQRRYRTEIGAFGKTAVCTRCSRPFKIGESRPPFQWKHTDLAEDSWIGVPPPEEKKEIKHCIICDAPLHPETIRCPECGANQVTGVVRRSRPVQHEEAESFWAKIPVRPILILLAVLVAGSGIYWGFKALTRKTQQVGEELADNVLVTRVARELREGATEPELARSYAGRVTDDNLDRFVTALGAASPNIQRAAAVLISAGQVTQIAPLVRDARSPDARTSEPARKALDAIGPRRLVELSCHESESQRRAAADALVQLFDLDAGQPRVSELARPATPAEKTALLNELCRPWPYLVGSFVVFIGEEVSPFTLTISQVGKVFYLALGTDELRTPVGIQRFEIPIDRWSAATGTAVDARSVRDTVSGKLLLESPHGVEWAGSVEVTARRKVTGPLPGFLPLEVPGAGRTAYAPVRLERPRR